MILVWFYCSYSVGVCKHTLKHTYLGSVSGSLLGPGLEGVLEGSDTHDVSILGLDT